MTDTSQVTNPDLVASREIQIMLGLDRRRVAELAHTDRITAGEFPPPAMQVASARLWKRDDIVAWAKVNGREIQP